MINLELTGLYSQERKTTMNAIAIYFLLNAANKQLMDADLELARGNTDTAAAWNNQAWGILRVVGDYVFSGGDLTPYERDALKGLEERSEKLVRLLLSAESEEPTFARGQRVRVVKHRRDDEDDYSETIRLTGKIGTEGIVDHVGGSLVEFIDNDKRYVAYPDELELVTPEPANA